MVSFRSTASVASVVGLLGAAGLALADGAKDRFPGSIHVWNCYPEVEHNCSAEDCRTSQIKPGPSSTRFGRKVRRLELSAGTFEVCPNAIDGCDMFRVKLDKGQSYTTVIGNDRGRYMIMRIRNRDGRFLRFSSLALVNSVAYGICKPAG